MVSRDGIRTALSNAVLNYLKVLSCNNYNLYITEMCREKMWTVAGTEFGPDQGMVVLVVRALYGLKLFGEDLRDLLA